METESKVNCFICDVPTKARKNVLLGKTKYSNEILYSKICDIIGDAFNICFSSEDLICIKCENILNDYDQLLAQIANIRIVFMKLLQKKYSLNQLEEILIPNHIKHPDKFIRLEHNDINYVENLYLHEHKFNVDSSDMKYDKRDNITMLNNGINTLNDQTNENPMSVNTPNTQISTKQYSFIRCIICSSNFKRKKQFQIHLSNHDDRICPECSTVIEKIIYKMYMRNICLEIILFRFSFIANFILPIFSHSICNMLITEFQHCHVY